MKLWAPEKILDFVRPWTSPQLMCLNVAEDAQLLKKQEGTVMKNYMVTHTLKSDEAMDAYYQALEKMSEADIRGAMKNERASFQMQWNAGKADKVMFCWWKAESAEAIVETLGEMAQLFDNDIREMPNVYDYTD